MDNDRASLAKGSRGTSELEETRWASAIRGGSQGPVHVSGGKWSLRAGSRRDKTENVKEGGIGNRDLRPSKTSHSCYSIRDSLELDNGRPLY